MNSVVYTMSGSSCLRSWLIALLTSLISISLAYAQEPALSAPVEVPPATSVSLLARYPAGSIQSVDTADRALEEVKQARAHIDDQFAHDERACYPKFFMTSCLQEAKERRRRDLAHIRPIEIDANAFKRHDRVDQRDKALAEKQVRETAQAPQRDQQQEREAESMKKAAGKESDAKSREQADEMRRANSARRTAAREERLKQREAKELADAQKRAENVAAYEQKVREAEARQRGIAAKKAGK